MGKALMLSTPNGTTHLSGDEGTFLGSGGKASSEAFTQYECTEGATFSNLGARITLGGSGTNTFRFRDEGAAGNQVVAFAGTGAGEDTVNTDILSALDKFNFAYTDTGSDSDVKYVKVNVEFASGHGNFHGATSLSSVFDVASSTRFLPLSGSLQGDGNATEAQTQWKNRGYTSFEALQVNVSANARTNTSTFKNRINGADGGLQVDFGTLATGLVTDTGSDALVDGDLIGASITLDTGVEDLTVRIVGCTLKSTTLKSESWGGHQTGSSRTASGTANYQGPGGYADLDETSSEANSRVRIGFAAIVSNLRCYVSANTLGGTMTIKIYKNGSAVLTLNVTAGAADQWFENSVDTITINDTDELSWEYDEGTSGSVTIHAVGMTFSPISTFQYSQLERGTRGLLRGVAPTWR